ncbi:hypothetical protein PG999_011463 [Apiospora kogelbergensis]|uniref:Uncharacterized protein n=1 Tax=Apiospora kogelbergensis TaxID=1337665 RepID=A0AAW0QPF8_9PEZI
MADANLLISNGTCYMSANKEAYKDYIPCGNAASGQHYQCCSTGDTCLSSNACFNFDYRTTYLVGCTDESYKAGVCPNKGDYSNQQWVSLIHCDNSPERSLDVGWFGCEEDLDKPYINSGNRDCLCSNRGDHSPLFFDGQILTNHANLPRTSGGTIAFSPGYTPTAAASNQPTKGSDGGTTVTSAPETSSGGGSAATGSAAASTTNSGGPVLSKGALAGVSAGAGVVAILLVALVFLVLRYRRIKTKNEPGYEGLRPSPAGTTRGFGGSPHNVDGSNCDDKVSPNTITPANTPVHPHHHQAGENNQEAHGYYKAELPADNPHPVIPSAGPSLCPLHTRREQQAQPLQYTAYDPDRDRCVPPLSAISERSNETAMMHSPLPRVSQQSTGRRLEQ